MTPHVGGLREVCCRLWLGSIVVCVPLSPLPPHLGDVIILIYILQLLALNTRMTYIGITWEGIDLIMSALSE